MRNALKQTLIFYGAALVLIMLYRALWLQQSDRRWIFLSPSLILVTAIIAELKRQSLQMYPWDIAEFGGLFPYHAWFDLGGVPGHGCSPAGHASAGYSLLAFYFFWRDVSPRKARYALGYK